MKQAPWSGQKVAGLARCLAALVAAGGLFSLGAILFALSRDGPPQLHRGLGACMGILLFYYTALFSYVAIKGHAPPGWLPWK